MRRRHDRACALRGPPPRVPDAGGVYVFCAPGVPAPAGYAVASAVVFPCVVCGKELASPRAREQHTEMVHAGPGRLRGHTGDAVQRRGAAVGAIRGAAGPAAARVQRVRAPAARRRRIRRSPPSAAEVGPPFDGCIGHWVERHTFPDHGQASEDRDAEEARKRTKSFGYFWCDKCERPWFSAHAFKYFAQACTGHPGCRTNCGVYFLPLYMWINDGHSVRDADSDDEGPHMQDLCRACTAGYCHRDGLPQEMNGVYYSGRFRSHEWEG